MIPPPRFASWLLEAALPTGDGEAMTGDLVEEFQDRAPRRGHRYARWWFCWQVARSLAPLFFRSWEKASLLRASFAIVSAGVAATLPATLLLMLRTFTLQQVPLKTTSELSTIFTLCLVLVVALTLSAGAAFAVRMLTARTRA